MKKLSPQHRPRSTAGFTLVEALIATSILTLSVVALSETLIATYSAESAIRRQEQSMLLAKDLAEQIAAKPISADQMIDAMPASNAVMMRSTGAAAALPAAESEVTQGELFRAPSGMAAMPTVDAVNGATDTVNAPVGRDNPAFGVYSRAVAVTRHRTPDGPVDPSGALRRITVTVTDPGGRPHVVSRITVPINLR